MSQAVHLRKYGVEATIEFEVYEVDGVDLRTDWVPAAADCEIMKDGGASTQCTNTATDEGSTYSIVLTATEMQAARLVLKVVDAATKVFLDKIVIIETYGNASAQHAADFSTTWATPGSGTDNITITQQMEDTSVMADVDIWITSDEAGTTVVAGALQSDSNGQVVFQLTDGNTYYCWRQKSGFTFTNPNTITTDKTIADGVTASGASTTITLTELRLDIRDGMLLADATTYPNDRVDRAIRMIGNDFLARTKCNSTTSTVATVASTATVDVDATITDFKPWHVLAMRIGYDEVINEGYDWIRRKLDDDTAEDQPEHYAFESADATMTMYPIPNAIYTVTIRYWRPFTTWTIGTGAGDGVTFNIPDEILLRFMRHGCAAVIQFNDPVSRYNSQAWNTYLEVVDSMGGSVEPRSQIIRDPSKY